MGGLVWLASYPKSGNTWVRLFFENLLSGAEFPLDINAVKGFSRSEAEISAFLRLEPQTRDYFTPERVAALRTKVQKYYADLTEGTLLLKTHCALVSYHNHPTISTAVTAGAIYLVRNPLDIVPSFARHMSYSLDEAIENMSKASLSLVSQDEQVGEPMSSWSHHVESWTRRKHRGLLVVRYEDLVADPVTHFGKIVAHVGLDPAPDDLLRAIDHVRFDVLKSQETESGFVEAPASGKFFNAGRTGGWRDALSRDQAIRIVRTHGKVMERFGYIPDDLAEFAGKMPPDPSIFLKFDCGAAMKPPDRFIRNIDMGGFELRF